MRTVALLSQKGGTGKTTLTVHLAVEFFLRQKAVAILDLDPQRSSYEWYRHRPHQFPHCEPVLPQDFTKELTTLEQLGAEYVFIDTAPHSESTAVEVLKRSDIVLIPIKPSILDLRAMARTIELAKLAKAKAYALLNEAHHSTLPAAQEVVRVVYNHYGLTFCPQVIMERVAYSRSMIMGLSAQEFEPNGKAAADIRKMTDWLEAL